MSSFVTDRVSVRPVQRRDYEKWRPLWDGYNSFYGREGATGLDEVITRTTWERFFGASEPMRCLVAETNEHFAGLAHFILHRSTTRLQDVCYLQDLFTAPQVRRRGIGRQLIAGVYEAAKAMGCSRVYWQTQATNATGRALYDQVARHHGFIVYTHEL